MTQAADEGSKSLMTSGAALYCQCNGVKLA